MVCGADVTHPRPGAPEGTPSIAALVASVDKDFVQYPASMCVQQPDPTKASKEYVVFHSTDLCTNAKEHRMIEDMKEMMTERLLLYKKKNKVLPEKIILYRDGVSEGQFDLVLQYELPKIEQAFVAVYGVGAALPKLSIVICGKRHHARPLPTSAETASDNGNTRPGTVVDKGITDVYRYDFYLQVSVIRLSRQRSTES
jgi:eukaryotic translation initiation factor 2C